MAWGKTGVHETLISTDDNIEVISMSDSVFNTVLSHTISSGGNTAHYFSFNDTTDSDYSYRQSENGAAEASAIDVADVVYDTGGDTFDKFSISYIFNISTEEKLVMGWGINAKTAGAATEPARGEFVWKWDNITDPISTIENDTSTQTGTYDIKSNISALGSNITPAAPLTSIQNNSLFITNDTNTRQMFKSNVALPDESFSTYDTPITATVDDDFTSYGSQGAADAVWVPATTATDVNISTDVLDYLVVGTDTTALNVYYDLGLISEDAWLLRFKLNFSTYTDGDFGQLPFAISDSGTDALGTSQANVGMVVNRSTGVMLNVTDNATHMVGNLSAEGSDFSASTDYYCQMSRNQLNFNLKIFSDSAYSVLIQEIDRDITVNIPVALRYFKIANDTVSGVGETTGTLDDFQFWDGVSQVVSPILETATVTDPLTSDLGWVHVTGDTSYDGTGDEIDFTDVNSTFINAYIDLQDADYLNGSNLDDDNFVIRGVVEKKDNPTDTANGTSIELCVSSTITDGWFNVSDSVGIVFVVNHTTGANNGFSVFSTDAQLTYTNQSATVAYDWQTGILYWEIRGDGVNVTAEIFTDSYFTSSLGTCTVSHASPTAMRYLSFRNFADAAKAGTSLSLQDVKIWNGISSAEIVDNLWVRNDKANNYQRVNVSTEKLDFDLRNDTSNDAIAYDLGESVSTTAWIMRFKMRFSTLTSSANHVMMFSLSDSDESVGSNTAQDWIALQIEYRTSNKRYGLFSLDAGTWAGDDVNVTYTFLIDTDYYVEFKLTSAGVFGAEIFTDSDYIKGSLGALSTTFVGTPEGLRYFKLNQRENITEGGIMTGTIDDFQFWNNVTTTLPYLETPRTFQEDFTSALGVDHTVDNTVVGGWLAQDISQNLVDGVNKTIDVNCIVDATNDNMSYDLGYNLSDIAWVMRFHFDLTVTTHTSGNDKHFMIGMSDKDSTVDSNTARNWIGLSWLDTSIGNQIQSKTCLDSIVLGSSDTRITFDHAPVVQTYYGEIARTSATTAEFRVYSDSTYVTLIEEIRDNNIQSGINSLRYISVLNSNAASAVGSIEGTINNIEIWNGFSSVT